MSLAGQGEEKQHPTVNEWSWAPASAKLQAWKGLDVRAARWPWDRPSQAQLWDTLPTLSALRSFFTTAFYEGLPIFLPTAFHRAPIQPNGFTPFPKGDAHQASDPLWKDPSLLPTLSDVSAWCIKEYLYSKFSNIAWIHSTIPELCSPFQILHWEDEYDIHLF